MSASYLIDAAHGLVFTRAWGVLADDEIIAHALVLRADPRFNPSFRQIVSFLDTTKIILTSEAIRSLAKHNPFPRDARRAIVVTTDEAYGLARMFMLYLDADPQQFEIFRAIGPALEWVYLDPEMTWPSREPDRIFGP